MANKTTISDCLLTKCEAIAKEGQDGRYCRGLLHFRGKMDESLAKELGCLDTFKNRHVDEFKIPVEALSDFEPDSQTYSLQLTALQDGHVQLTVGAVSLYQIVCKRDDNGEVVMKVKAAFDSRYGRAVNEFVWDVPGWYGGVVLAPTQESLNFDPADIDDEDDDETEEAEAA